MSINNTNVLKSNMAIKQKELTIAIKNVYGKETIYPACNHSIALADFKGQKTFTEQDLIKLKKTGYTFRLRSSHYLKNIMGNMQISEIAY